MSVLVTGGAGYIGSHLVWHLTDVDEDVIVLDSFSTGFPWAVPPETRIVTGDCGDEALLGRIFAENRVNAVFHLAGSIVVPESIVEPLRYYLNNTVKSRALIESAVTAGVPHIIFSSTAAVYGTPASFPVPEDAPLAPESPYGRSKLMTEMMLADVSAAHGITYAALRYFNVAGADPKGRTGQSTCGTTHLIKVACETALGKRQAITIFGDNYPTPDGTCIRDYIHVTDLVAAHADALRYLRAGGGNLVANCGYGRGFSVLEVLDTVKRVSGRDFPVALGTRRPGDPACVVASTALITERLGWQPRYANLDGIVETALSWEETLSRRNQGDQVPSGGESSCPMKPARSV